ncbi:MAG TPA: aminopeptidase P N-terminal domain-containing protein [Candidatus Saccharimonadales bacterium]
MSDIFGSDFFTGNRERLRQLFTGTAPIVITANGLLQQATSEPYKFRQDGSFWYLTGIDEPDIILVMDKGREYLIVPGREASREAFDGAIQFEDLARRSGIADILNEKDGWKQLSSRVKKVRHVATLAANPPYIEGLGMYANPARAMLIKNLKEINSELELLDLRQHVSRMRMVKQSAELVALQAAIDITLDTLKEVTRRSQLVKYAYEYEVEADITRGFRRRGSEGHAFWPIVAGGSRACVLHNINNNAPLASDELLTLDVGASVNHYCADITRTIILGERASRRQQNVHEAVQAAQDYAYSLLKPGVMIAEYEKQMEQFMGEKLRELGLINSIERDSVRHYFPHATSHFLGIDVHDSGNYDHPLEAGVVMTVEPGIYIPEEGIGVRIEDDVLITPDGCEILSKKLPREL